MSWLLKAMEILGKEELTEKTLQSPQHSSTILSSNSHKVKLEILFEVPPEVRPELVVSSPPLQHF